VRGERFSHDRRQLGREVCKPGRACRLVSYGDDLVVVALSEQRRQPAAGVGDHRDQTAEAGKCT
jgi:hypothetical protein